LEDKREDSFYVKDGKISTKRCRACNSLRLKERYDKDKRREVFLKNKILCGVCKKNLMCSPAKRCFPCLSMLRKEGKIKSGKPFSRGRGHPNWIDGSTNLRDKIRATKEYKRWRFAILKRDKWTCTSCGNLGGDLNTHHIRQVARILFEDNIKTVSAALKNKDLFSLKNGITLCRTCHSHIKHDSWLKLHHERSLEELKRQRKSCRSSS